jgi:hypothetical protein
MEKRTLSNFIKNTQTQEENIKIPAEGIFIISKMLEHQNKVLLEKIAKKKFSDPEEREMFVEQFHKIGFHIPEIAETNNQESLQKFLL